MRRPKLIRKPNGYYCAKWGGVEHYYGTKIKAVALPRYHEDMERWEEWKLQRLAARRDRRQRSTPDGITVETLRERFLEAKRLEHGVDCERHYKKHLERFRQTIRQVAIEQGLRSFDADLLGPEALNRFKLDLLERGLAPRTINHDLTTIRVMYNWGAAAGLLQPMNLSVVRNVPVGPVDDPALPKRRILAAFKQCPPLLAPWFAINYLALLRPSEVVRLMRAKGRWHTTVTGIFVLDRGKIDKRATIRRHCIFSPLAGRWLEHGWELARREQAADRKPLKWNRLDSYSTAIRRLGLTPKALQKSAAAHLLSHRGVAPADVELALGHVRTRISVTYYIPAWRKLRLLTAKLTFPAPP